MQIKIIDLKIIEFKRPHSKKACFKESKVKRGEKTDPFRSSFTVTFFRNRTHISIRLAFSTLNLFSA